MELNKSNIKKIMGIIVASLVISWGISHMAVIVQVINGILTVIAPFLMGLCFAFMINILLRKIERLWDGAVGKRESRIGKQLKRPLCLLISLTFIGGVIFIILFMVIPELQKNIMTIADMFPQYVNNVTGWWDDLTETALKYSIVLPEIHLNGNETGDVVGSFLSERGGHFLNKTVDFTVSVFTVVFNVVLGLVFAVYVLAQKEKLSGQVKKLLLAVLPSERVKAVTDFAALTNRVFTSFVAGQLMESVIIGMLCFLGMVILRMPYASVVSVLVGFTALIPVFGAFIGTAVGAFLILVIDPWKALVFVIFLIILQQVEGNIIYPRVVGKSVGLPGIWVLTAVTVGGSVFGVLGMLLGVPVCSVLYFVIRQAVNQKLEKKGIENS